jgi:hypothetical protein
MKLRIEGTEGKIADELLKPEAQVHQDHLRKKNFGMIYQNVA